MMPDARTHILSLISISTLLAGTATLIGCVASEPPAAGRNAVPGLPTLVALPSSTIEALPTPRSGEVGRLLLDPPAAMTPVTIDAWYGQGWTPWPGRGRFESMSGCPSIDSSPLLDRPLWQTLHLGGRSSSNHAPESDPWLIAAAPVTSTESTPIRLELPSFARLRGHLGDPAYAHCDHAERIFVVEEVLEAHEPAIDPWAFYEIGPDRWTAYHDPEHGLRLHHPRGWSIERMPGILRLISSDWPDRPLSIRFYGAEDAPNTQDPSPEDEAVSELDRNFPYDGLRMSQYHREEFEIPEGAAELSGWASRCALPDDADHGCVEIRIEGRGQVILLRQDFGLDAALEPGLLTTLDLIFDSLVLEGWPTETPSPADLRMREWTPYPAP